MRRGCVEDRRGDAAPARPVLTHERYSPLHRASVTMVTRRVGMPSSGMGQAQLRASRLRHGQGRKQNMDERADPEEKQNLAEDPKYKDTVTMLQRQLRSLAEHGNAR